MSVTREDFRANFPCLADQCVCFVGLLLLEVHFGQQEIDFGLEIVILGLDNSINDLFRFEGVLERSVLWVVLRDAFVIGALGVQESLGL